MDIERWRGDTYADVVKLLNRGDGSPVNLTGSSFLFTLNSRKSHNSGYVQVYQLDGIVDTPASGVVQFTPTAEQADIVGYYYYNIQMIDSLGGVRTLAKGRYVYRQD